MSGILRRKCCCGPAPQPPPTTCDCSQGLCPSSFLATFSGQVTITFDNGNILKWQYTGNQAPIDNFGGCGGAQSDVATGSMSWEAIPPAPGCPSNGVCPLSGWDGINLAAYPLIGLSCGLTLFNPVAQSFGITTPTYWTASIQPVKQQYITGGVFCPCNWIENPEYGAPTTGIALYWPRFSACANSIGGSPYGMVLGWQSGTYPIPGSSGVTAIPGGTAVVSAGASFA